MRFPNTEAKIIALAQKIIAGLQDNSNFPNPPTSPDQLQASLDKVIASSDAQVMALAASKQATDTKQADFDHMMTEMKSILHYAEDAVHDDDALLSELGWGGRAEPHALQVPGQPRLLEVPEQGAGWLTLDWKKPANGGAPASYKIERRELTENSAWTLAGIAIDTEVTLNSQEHGKEWEYRVIAINKAGEGEPSNTVTAVL
ncbi:MAG: fibronectin type III domain-containing protein [Candidatus Electrothrix sp. AX1]|nr:fibronectin type III domain-containing protein [Candidatus Electrothrix sp. AX1]